MSSVNILDDDGKPIVEGTVLKSAKTSYCVKALLGAGGFGAVYRVEDMSTNLIYATKIEKKMDKRRHSKLKMEVEILKSVDSIRGENSHFVSIVDRAKKNLYFFIVMTLVGPSLDDLRKSRPHKIFSIGTSIGIGWQCLEAIEDLHKQGYIHRDVKPSNYAIGLNEKIRT
uniref:Protein kinase domain-containing protein n=1 Tax=Panagrolaimus sp. JU765 TaxID=591449 RepID=A0AC34R451_9BILA